jgi:hypothetical protein
MNGRLSRACLLLLMLALLCGCSLRSAEREAGRGEGSRQADEVRQQVKDLEDAWNRGDTAGVVRQYHPSVYVRVNSERWEYAKEVEYIEKWMKKEPRLRLRIEVNVIRPLGRDYAVVDGSFHMISQDGSDSGGPYAAIWMRSNGHWQCVYTHS